MSTLTAGPPSSSDDIELVTVAVNVEAVTPARVLTSEWIKMRSLRSTTLTLLAAFALMVALGWIFGWATSANWSAATWTTRPHDARRGRDSLENPCCERRAAFVAIGIRALARDLGRVG